MEEKEWTLLSRGERENILTQIGIKKEAIDRNAKVNFDFLDEDVKQALGVKRDVHEEMRREKIRQKELWTKDDVRHIEIEEAWYADKIQEMGKFLNLGRESLRKGDYMTLFSRYAIACMLLREIQERGDPSYYKQAELVLLAAKKEFAERLKHKCKKEVRAYY